LLIAGIGLLHVIPLNGFIPAAQELMTQRFGQPVRIGVLRYALLPSPQLTLERVTIGKFEDIKADTLIVAASPFAFFGSDKSFDRAEASSVNATAIGLAAAASWIKPREGSAAALSVGRVRLKGVQLDIKAIDLPRFDADIALARNGALQKASLTDGKVTVTLAPRDKAIDMTLEARGWRLPILPGIEFDDLSIAGVLGNDEATISRVEGNLGAGKLTGDGKLTWASGLRMQGTFALRNADLAQVLGAFTRQFSATGTLSANGKFAMQGDTVAALIGSARAEASFNVEKGTLANVDLVRAIQSPARDGVRGGKTLFTVLAGSIRAADKQYSYRQLNLNSGQMNASGNIDVAPDGELSGRVTAEIGTKSMVVARGTLNVAGNMKTPVLKP
jgi:uncharacterized protein involved in outer membrane biogenesis